MSIAQTLLPEFDHEMANTRLVLERIPNDKLDWRAHPKSNTIGWVGRHLAEIAHWAEGALTRESWDVAPVEGEAYQTPKLASTKEILDYFDKHLAVARKALEATSDEAFQADWSLLTGGKPLFTMPRVAVLRTFILSHTIHHRAILCVYLRLNDIPVPGMYGPSGDEPK